jgi:hypothetical protein
MKQDDMMDALRNEDASFELNFEAAVTRALEQAPVVAVPEGFAARVRAALPEPPKARVRRDVRMAAAAWAVAGLLVALCVLAPHARPSFESVAFDMEMLLLVELAGVGAWMAGRHRGV